MWNRNTVFHLITFNQNYYLQIYLQFTLTLWFSILTSATPPNCIIYCNLCVAIRTKAYLNQCFWIYFNNFGIYNFWNGEAFSSLSVNSMLILLLSATVVDSVDDLLNCKWFYLRIFPFEIYFCFFNWAKVIDDYVSIVFAASKPFNFFFQYYYRLWEYHWTIHISLRKKKHPNTCCYHFGLRSWNTLFLSLDNFKDDTSERYPDEDECK